MYVKDIALSFYINLQYIEIRKIYDQSEKIVYTCYRINELSWSAENYDQ